jgi:hypothetical protein
LCSSVVEVFLLFSCWRFHGFWDFGVLVIGTVSAREKTSDADVPEFHRSERLTRGPHFGSVSEFSGVETVKCFVSFVLSFLFFVLCHTSPALWVEGRARGWSHGVVSTP